jgi:hypothetical protein
MEEVQVPRRPASACHTPCNPFERNHPGAGGTGAGFEADRHMQLALAILNVPELHSPDLPRNWQLQRGSKQIRSIHAPNLPETHLATNQLHPPQTAKSQSIIIDYTSLVESDDFDSRLIIWCSLL